MRVRSRRLAVGSGRRSSSRRYAAQYIGPGWHAGSLLALRRYGMFVADNGNDWFVSGSTDSRWNDTELDQRKSVPASAFEVVQAGPIIR